MVFANKKVLTGPQETFDYMTSKEHRGRCKFESSVGAGTPFIACTQRVVAGGDRIKAIQGLTEEKEEEALFVMDVSHPQAPSAARWALSHRAWTKASG